jgi:hypothetical protein
MRVLAGGNYHLAAIFQDLHLHAAAIESNPRAEAYLASLQTCCIGSTRLRKTVKGFRIGHENAITRRLLRGEMVVRKAGVRMSQN